MRVTSSARSHVGHVRTNNEDHFLIARLGRSLETLSTNLPEGHVPARIEQIGYVFTVADGMGGSEAGEVASAMAIEIGIKLALESPKWSFDIDPAEARELTARVAKYFEKIHGAVRARAKSDTALTGMGTTLTSAYSVGLDLFTFHVGDSRAYLYRDGVLEQLTQDDTVAQLLADSGQIPQDEAAHHPTRHVLTSAVGATRGEIAPEIQQVRLAPGDRLLVCSDGLTDMVDDAAITEILRDGADPDAACNTLIERALAAGGKDNVTAIVVHYAQDA